MPPESIPDYLALVGDSADGFPGLPGWGAKSAGAVLARYGQLEDIPADRPSTGTSTCAAPASSPPPCRERFDEALLFRRIATIERDAPVIDDRRRAAVDRARPSGSPSCAGRLDAPRLAERAKALAAARAP